MERAEGMWDAFRAVEDAKKEKLVELLKNQDRVLLEFSLGRLKRVPLAERVSLWVKGGLLVSSPLFQRVVDLSHGEDARCFISYLFEIARHYKGEDILRDWEQDVLPLLKQVNLEETHLFWEWVFSREAPLRDLGVYLLCVLPHESGHKVLSLLEEPFCSSRLKEVILKNLAASPLCALLDEERLLSLFFHLDFQQRRILMEQVLSLGLSLQKEGVKKLEVLVKEDPYLLVSCALLGYRGGNREKEELLLQSVFQGAYDSRTRRILEALALGGSLRLKEEVLLVMTKQGYEDAFVLDVVELSKEMQIEEQALREIASRVSENTDHPKVMVALLQRLAKTTFTEGLPESLWIRTRSSEVKEALLRIKAEQGPSAWRFLWDVASREDLPLRALALLLLTPLFPALSHQEQREVFGKRDTFPESLVIPYLKLLRNCSIPSLQKKVSRLFSVILLDTKESPNVREDVARLFLSNKEQFPKEGLLSSLKDKDTPLSLRLLLSALLVPSLDTSCFPVFEQILFSLHEPKSLRLSLLSALCTLTCQESLQFLLKVLRQCSLEPELVVQVAKGIANHKLLPLEEIQELVYYPVLQIQFAGLCALRVRGVPWSTRYRFLGFEVLSSLVPETLDRLLFDEPKGS